MIPSYLLCTISDPLGANKRRHSTASDRSRKSSISIGEQQHQSDLIKQPAMMGNSIGSGGSVFQNFVKSNLVGRTTSNASGYPQV